MTDIKKKTKQITLNDKYLLLPNIGSGSFGEVFLLEDNFTKNQYAGKIETIEKDKKSLLKREYKIYCKLKNNGMNFGIPKIIDYLELPKQNILVMDLLGKSLDDLFDKYNNKFDLGTVLKLAIDMITLIEHIHISGFIHRDIKPNNFMIGKNNESKDDTNTLYIIDFGLSKKYIDSHNNHIKFDYDKSLIGTVRYTSINMHHGFEPSRRDDLESIGYILIQFMLGKLPWQGLRDKNGKPFDKDEQMKIIGKIKMATPLKELCKNIPSCFYEYVNYCRKLKFEETPDYNYLRSLFINTSTLTNTKINYCWNFIPLKHE